MPDWAGEVRRRLQPLRLTPSREAEIVDELSQHLEDRYQELCAAGIPPDVAERRALEAFESENRLARGIAPLRQAQSRDAAAIRASTGSWPGGLWQDVRYAMRASVRQPAFTAAVVLTLALGIGATTAIFSVVYGVVLRPLPFADPERLVSLQQHAPHGAGTNHGRVTFLTYQQHQQAFEAIGAWDPADVSITGRGEPERVEALRVSSTTLPILRVQPSLGRFFGAEDDTTNQPLRVVLTHAYWRQRFGGDANAIGQSLTIDGRPAEVIGVLPASFTFLRARPRVLLPLPLDRAAPPGISFGFQALARLKPGVTLAQANDDVARLISLLPPMFARLDLSPNVRPLADDVIRGVDQVLWILLAAVGVVLCIACGNVANLFLLRAETRRQELALRAALGAGRGRLARALLSESVWLALGGGAVGVLLAQLAVRLLHALAPQELPRLDDIAIDAAALVFTLAIAVVTGIVFGTLAVLRFGRPDASSFKDQGRAVSDGPDRQRVRDALVMGQVALALTLLIVSGLMTRTFVELLGVQPGFSRPEEVQTFTVAIPAGTIGDAHAAVRTHQAVAEELSRVPGVQSVGLSSSVTMDGEDNGNVIEVDGTATVDAPDGRIPLRRFKSVGPGYFETMGNPLVAGRAITWSDILEERPVIILSSVLAREYFGDPALALGRRVRGSTDAPWREIVGVSGDERDDGLHRPPTPIVYWPMLNESYRWRTMVYAVRSTRVGAPGFLDELRRAVWRVNADLPLDAVQTLEAIRAQTMAQSSFMLVMFAIAATVALLIGVVGLYSVMAYAVTRRTREIGIRMALGARTADVQTMFLRQGLLITAVGIGIGLAAAALLTRAISSYLFGVTAIDPATYVAVSALLAVVSAGASYLPARRAARVEPVIALRV